MTEENPSYNHTLSSFLRQKKKIKPLRPNSANCGHRAFLKTYQIWPKLKKKKKKMKLDTYAVAPSIHMTGISGLQ